MAEQVNKVVVKLPRTKAKELLSLLEKVCDGQSACVQANRCEISYYREQLHQALQAQERRQKMHNIKFQ